MCSGCKNITKNKQVLWKYLEERENRDDPLLTDEHCVLVELPGGLTTGMDKLRSRASLIQLKRSFINTKYEP